MSNKYSLSIQEDWRSIKQHALPVLIFLRLKCFVEWSVQNAKGNTSSSVLFYNRKCCTCKTCRLQCRSGIHTISYPCQLTNVTAAKHLSIHIQHLPTWQIVCHYSLLASSGACQVLCYTARILHNYRLGCVCINCCSLIHWLCSSEQYRGGSSKTVHVWRDFITSFKQSRYLL